VREKENFKRNVWEKEREIERERDFKIKKLKKKWGRERESEREGE
jgi:hypothetical protein